MQQKFPTVTEWGNLESGFDKKLSSARAFIAALMQKVHEEVREHIFNGIEQESYEPTIDAFHGLLNDQIHYLIVERGIENVDGKKYLIIRQRILQEIARRAFELFTGADEGDLLTTLWDRVDLTSLQTNVNPTSLVERVAIAGKDHRRKKVIAGSPM